MTFFRYALLALACTATQAGAASFDCAKAATHAEKTICSDAALSTLVIFESPDCHVSLTLKGNVLTVEDSNTCGGAHVTFTGQYRRK